MNPDKCPGEVVKLEPGSVTAKGNTANLKNDYNSGTNLCGGGNSNEAVYTVTATESGYVKIDVQADNFNPSLYARRECGNADTRINCAGSFNNDVSIQFPVLAGATFSVFVDGYGTGNEAGPYTLKMTLTPSVCVKPICQFVRPSTVDELMTGLTVIVTGHSAELASSPSIS